MSSRSPTVAPSPRSRRQLLTALAATLLAGPMVAACQPLYGPTASGVPLKEVMASIDIATIPGRVGQRLRNELIYSTTLGGRPAESKYRLVIIVREALTPLLVEQSGEAQGQMFQLDAQFTLVQIASNKVVLKGNSSGRAAFDRYEQAFANIRARVDAENRAATTVADGIRSRIASFLSRSA